MSADESRRAIRRGRPVERVVLPAGPVRDLGDVLYRLYAEADCPRLDDLAEAIAADDSLLGSPRKDLISKIVSGDGLASQQDTVTVAVALAREAGRVDAGVLAEKVRRLWIAARTVPPVRLGRPVGDCDPLVLEVHPAIEVSGLDRRMGRLPAYVERAHDMRLRVIADQVVHGQSRLVTLVGGSSTGKTRACWEVAQYVAFQQPGRWWLWHPYDPTRPEAAAAAIDQIGPHTIVWLNEAQFYLALTDEQLGERIAAGLRTLLQDPGRMPVLVLATLWPRYWSMLSISPQAGQPDPYAQARYLLTGTEIIVAETFTPGELAGLEDAAGSDARFREAAAHAESGRITQYLAGAPALEARYRTAPPAARAVIQAAMDARRLGHPLALPLALLEQAAPAYLDDHDWDALGDDWLEQALAYTATPCQGARGPLTRIRSRPGSPHPDGGQPRYRLADYLDQLGRAERAATYPPDSLWAAFTTTVTDPDLLWNLGIEAEVRGRLQHAVPLYVQAADRGDTRALWHLAMARGSAGDHAGHETLVLQAVDRGHFDAIRVLAWDREHDGDVAGVEALYRKAIDCGGATALWAQALGLEKSGDHGGAEALAVQAADHGNTAALWDVAMHRGQAGDTASAEALYRQVTDRQPGALLPWAGNRREQGDDAGAEALAMHAADRGDTEVLRFLALQLEEAGNTAGAEALYRRSADRGKTGARRARALAREDAGDTAGAVAVAIEAADYGDTAALWMLAVRRDMAGDAAGAQALAIQAADRGDTSVLRVLSRRCERAGDTVGAEALAIQFANRGNRANPHGIGIMARLREGAGDVASADRLRRFGLTGAGTPATRLDFGPYGGPIGADGR